mgnify:CR=1 FL=1
MANLPWQNRPENNKDILWRYSKNPIINRYDIPSSNSIFNSAVVPYKEGFAGVFRCDNKVGDQIGNLFDNKEIKLPNNPIICDKTFCVCSQDVSITKWKNI